MAFKSLLLGIGAALLFGIVAHAQPPQWKYQAGPVAVYPGSSSNADILNVFASLTPAQITSVQAENNAVDVTSAIQSAVNAAAGKTLYFPVGNYKLSSEIDITNALNIVCAKGASLVLSTQNQNGFVIGDGTTPTKSATYNTGISNCTFIPFPGVSASTAGAAINVNDAGYYNLNNNSVYGQDVSTKKLFNGIKIFEGVEGIVNYNLFQHLIGDGIFTSGSAYPAVTVDQRLDFNEAVDTANGVNISTNSGGITVNNLIAYELNSGWCIKEDAGSGTGALNFFINQIDCEVDTGSTGGVYQKSSSNMQFTGGTIISSGTTLIGLQQDSTASGITATGVSFDQATLILNGPADRITGGDITGDNNTQTVGLTINSTATDFNITGTTVRQWITDCISFVGNPARASVTGVNFRSCPVEETGQSFNPSLAPPQNSGGQTDSSNALTAAASLILHNGRNIYVVTGATAINTLTNLGNGVRITLEGGTGGITLNNSGNIQLSASPTTIPSGSTISLINDGQNWFQDGGDIASGGSGTVTTSGSPAAGNMAEFSASTVIGPDVGGGTLGGPTGGQEGAGTINVKNGYYLNGSEVNVVPFSSSCTFGACTYTLPGITDTLLGAGTVESISQLYTFSAGLTVSGGTLTDSSSTLALFSNGLNVGNNKCISSPGNPNNLCLVMDSSNGNGFLTGLYFNYNAAIRGLDCGAGGAGNNSASSGLFACNYMSATIAQTGTAGWAGLDVNPTISSSGSGHADAIVVHHGSTRYAGITYSGLVFTKGFTVSTLPTAASQDQGSRAFVTDQLTACVVAGAALTGGGSVVCPVFDNGSAWVGD